MRAHRLCDGETGEWWDGRDVRARVCERCGGSVRVRGGGGEGDAPKRRYAQRLVSLARAQTAAPQLTNTCTLTEAAHRWSSAWFNDAADAFPDAPHLPTAGPALNARPHSSRPPMSSVFDAADAVPDTPDPLTSTFTSTTPPPSCMFHASNDAANAFPDMAPALQHHAPPHKRRR
jgi:hypothetical protein